MKHLLKVLSLRAVIMGLVATGLCLIFPLAVIPIVSTSCALYLASSVMSVISANKIEKEKANVTVGDLEYHKFNQPGNSLENSIIKTIDSTTEKISARKKLPKKVNIKGKDKNIIKSDNNKIDSDLTM